MAVASKSGGNSGRRYDENHSKDEYAEAVKSVLEKVGDGQQRRYLQEVFNNDKGVKRIYRELRNDGDSPEDAIELIKNGAVSYRKGESGGKGSLVYDRAGLYHTIGELMIKSGSHERAIKGLVKEGYMDENEGKMVSGRIGKRVDGHLEKLARAAVWLFVAVGAVIMLTSGFSMTGAVIGSGSVMESSVLFVIGFVLFVMGLVLNFREK